MSHLKLPASDSKSQQYSKSSTKRLFESVFRMLDHDELEVSPFENSCKDTNGSRIKHILRNQSLHEILAGKIKLESLHTYYPILEVSCSDHAGMQYILEPHDIREAFNKFGCLYQIYPTPNQHIIYALYTSFCSAYVAMKLLNDLSLRHSAGARLSVKWSQPNNISTYYDSISMGEFKDYDSKIDLSIFDPKISHNNENYMNAGNLPPLKLQRSKDSNSTMNGSDIEGGLRQNKLTCRYNIQIQNEREFQVARRIIGAKGSNMKRIIENTLKRYNDGKNAEMHNINTNQLLKLRLRGRGSGYKEGPDQLESEENLHLCISAKDETVYSLACESVEKLLHDMYAEYREYTRRQGKEVVLAISKSDLNSFLPNGNVIHYHSQNHEMRNLEIEGKMNPAQIQQFLEMRNKARRELNFGEADRIRNYLRVCGVFLIDEKGRRGRANEVTTWKYLL